MLFLLVRKVQIKSLFAKIQNNLISYTLLVENYFSTSLLRRAKRPKDRAVIRFAWIGKTQIVNFQHFQ